MNVVFVAPKIPVVTLEPSCVLHENVSWMLQTALNMSAKADSVYEYIEDVDILRECETTLGLTKQDIGLVRFKREDLQGVKAIGTTGKRSVMLALVIALVLHRDDPHEALWKELREYSLDKAFLSLIQDVPVQAASCQHRGDHHHTSGGSGGGGGGQRSRQSGSDHYERSSGSRGGGYGEWSGGRHSEQNGDWPGSEQGRTMGAVEVAGVQLQMILGKVPVIELDATSVFHENVSWLLQTALDASGKADAIFEYFDDKQILAECKRKMGLTPQDCGIVRMRRKDLQGVKAVGTNGKRASMLATLVAYALHTKDNLDKMRPEVAKFQAPLGEAFDSLLRAAAHLSGVQLNWRFGAGGPATWSGDGGKRDDDFWGDRSSGRSDGWSDDWLGHKGSTKKSAKPAKARPSPLDADQLDEQLASYFYEPVGERGRRSSRRRGGRDDHRDIKEEVDYN